MNRIAVVSAPAAGEILSTPAGFDMDHDGNREFALRTGIVMPGEIELLEVHECSADNTFVLAHVLDLEEHPSGNDLYTLADAGDADGDGLTDLVVLARHDMGANPSVFGTQVYESLSIASYPNALVWEALHAFESWSRGGFISDTDADGKRELVVTEPEPGAALVVYESDGDNSYSESWSMQPLPQSGTRQSWAVFDDLDGDGRDEIVIGGIADPNIIAFESTGDNSYAFSWSWDFGSQNVVFLVDGGDLDGDGKEEFLAGGMKPNSQSHFYVFEAIGDNDVEIVFTFILPNSVDFYTSANVADVDGDGRREIVFATGSVVKILENAGDNAWHEIWTGAGGSIQAIGAGDHDQDGKDEIIFRTGPVDNGTTSIWEIDPAYQADMDGDDRVDAIDNCPIDFNPDQQDADLDAVGDACDNCLHGPNPDQGPAPLGQTIVATDPATFSWPSAADVVHVRGGLAGVSAYVFDELGTLPRATSLSDNDSPPAGSGFWYLLRPDCPLGSWQSEIGAEPGRDAALP
jgi:hypothetical protein